MKKLLLLSALLIFACSSDDSSNDDSIEGIWYLVSSTVDGEIQELDSCELESYLDISMDSFSETLCDNVIPSLYNNDGNPISENFEGSLIYYRTFEEINCTDADSVPRDNREIYINETNNSNNYDFYLHYPSLANFGVNVNCDFENYLVSILDAVINGNILTLFSVSLNGEIIIEVFEKN